MLLSERNKSFQQKTIFQLMHHTLDVHKLLLYVCIVYTIKKQRQCFPLYDRFEQQALRKQRLQSRWNLLRSDLEVLQSTREMPVNPVNQRFMVKIIQSSVQCCCVRLVLGARQGLGRSISTEKKRKDMKLSCDYLLSSYLFDSVRICRII